MFRFTLVLAVVLALGSTGAQAKNRSKVAKETPQLRAARARAREREALIPAMKEAVRQYVVRWTGGRPGDVPAMADMLKQLDTLDFRTRENFYWLKSWAYMAGWKGDVGVASSAPAKCPTTAAATSGVPSHPAASPAPAPPRKTSESQRTLRPEDR